MYPPKKPLEAGTPLFVELPAEVLHHQDGNPYFYRVRLIEGGQEFTVNILQMNTQQSALDRSDMVSGPDGSIILRFTRYSRNGARELYERLRTMLEGLGELPSTYLEERQQRALQRAQQQQQEASNDPPECSDHSIT